MDPATYCRRLTRKSGSNFYYPLLLLPAKKRRALYAIYAFCRHTDDIVDEAADRDAARKGLEAWKEELNRVYQGSPHHPITRHLEDILTDFPIPKGLFENLIRGVEMDLHQNRYQTFEELYLYCYRVASVVGLACIEVFGYSHPQVKEYAIAQGIAFQLTNILRDLSEDLQRDRIYLPIADLDHFGYPEADLRERKYNDAFLRMMRHQCERAEGYYIKAASLLWQPDRSQLIISEIMRAIYWEVLQTIKSSGYRVFDRRITLPVHRKISLALSTWRAGRRVSAERAESP